LIDVQPPAVGDEPEKFQASQSSSLKGSPKERGARRTLGFIEADGRMLAL